MSVASIDYNVSKWTNALLEEYKGDDPSFSVHFHEAHWTLNNSATCQFLYSQPISSILDDIRALRIPTDYIDLFDKSDVRFFEGCLIVELYDHRLRVSKKSTDNGTAEAVPEPQRVVLQPTAETLYRDIRSIAEAEHAQGRVFTDQDALELESDILLLTSQPLCLDPDINVTRIANRLIRVSSPTVPRSLKRKRGDTFDDSGEEDEFVQRSKAKLMQFMNPRVGRTFNPRLTDGRLSFNKVRNTLNTMSQVTAIPPPPQGQSAGLSVNTAVGSAASLPSAGSSKGKGDLGKKDERKPKISMEAVLRGKARMGKSEDSPVSASTNMSLPSAIEEPKPRVILNVRPPQAVQGVVKKDEPQAQRIPTPVQPVPTPGRVATPVQQHRAQTPVQPLQQPTPTLGHAVVAPNPTIPSAQTSGLSFQPGQLSEGFLRAPPVPRNPNAAAPPNGMAGKRPATPQQAAAAAALLNAQAMKMAAAGQQRPNGAVAFNQMQNAAFIQQQQQARYAMAMASRGALPPGQNRFSGALQMARPGVGGVGVAPNMNVIGAATPNMGGGSEQQVGSATVPAPAGIPLQNQQQWLQAMAARGGVPPQQLWQMQVAAGRGGMLPGRGQMHPQQLAMLQQLAHAQQMQAQAHAQAGRGAGGQPKPPGAR